MTTGMATSTDQRSTTYYDTSELRRAPRLRHAEGPARAGDVVVAALRSQVRQLRAQAPRVRQELPEAVTRMRVATRQLRSVLHGFSRILDPEQTQPVADELKWLGAQLAEEHDIEVMIERFTQVIRALPAHLIMGPLASDLERSLGQLAEQGEQAIMAALDSDRYLALQHMLDQLLEHPPLTRKADRSAQAELPRAVARAFRKLDRQLAESTALPAGPDRDAALHEARKVGKRVRYMTDVATPIIGAPARRLAKQTKKLQDLLGDYQDAVVARPVLRQLAATAHEEGHNAFTYGVLHALEHGRMEHVLRELPTRLDRLREDSTLAWLHLNPTGQRDPTPIPPSEPLRLERSWRATGRRPWRTTSSEAPDSTRTRTVREVRSAGRDAQLVRRQTGALDPVGDLPERDVAGEVR